MARASALRRLLQSPALLGRQPLARLFSSSSSSDESASSAAAASSPPSTPTPPQAPQAGASGAVGPPPRATVSATVEMMKKMSPTGSILDFYKASPSAGKQPDTPRQPDTGSSSSNSSRSSGAASTSAPSPDAAKPSKGVSIDRDVVRVIVQAVENIKPCVQVGVFKGKNHRTYVPGPITNAKARSLAVRWLVEATRKRKEASPNMRMAECLATEVVLAYQGRGDAMRKREDLHTLALQNRANISRRWWM